MLKYLLVVSLALNVSFLGAAAYTRYVQPRFQASAPFVMGGRGHGPFGPGMPMRSPAEGRMPGWMFQELGLKPEQVKALQQKAQNFHAALQGKRQEVDAARADLFRLVRSENPDRNAIETTIARISKTQEEMQKAVVNHMLEFKAMLNAEQQKKFFNMMEGSMGPRGGMQCR